MNLINIICRQLNISHRDLAVLINSPRTTVTKAAAGNRNLPYVATMQLVQYNKAMLQAKLHVPKTTGLTGAQKAELKKSQNDCAFRMLVLQKKMQKISTAYQTALLLQSTLNSLNHESLNSKQINWITELSEKATNTIEKNNPYTLQKLQLEIELLQLKQNRTSQMLADEGSNL